MKYSKKCPRCGNYELSLSIGAEDYIYYAICKYCQHELDTEERSKIMEAKKK